MPTSFLLQECMQLQRSFHIAFSLKLRKLLSPWGKPYLNRPFEGPIETSPID